MIVHRDMWSIYNGDFMEWDPRPQFQLDDGAGGTVPGVHWQHPDHGETGALNWFGGPGVGGNVYAGRWGPLAPEDIAKTGSRYGLFYYVVTPATEGGDGTPDGWMTILESDSDGGSLSGILTPWSVARWAGKIIRLSCWLSTNTPVAARLVAWQSYGGGPDASPFPGVLAGDEVLVQPGGYEELEAVLEVPSVDGGVSGSDPYVGVGLDIRAGFAGVLSVTGWRVREVE